MAEGLPKFGWTKKQNANEPSSPPISSMVEIMSETLANELQEQDLLEFDLEQEALEASLRELDVDQNLDENDCSNDLALAMALAEAEDPDYSADMSLALQLQKQFDREDQLQSQLASEKSVVSKRGTTIALAPDSYQYKKIEDELKGQDNDELDDEREMAVDEKYRSKAQEFPPCGFRRNQNGEIITKHNKEVGQQRNCQKMMQFQPNFNSGDLLEEKLSSRIYNDLQMFSKGEAKRQARLKDKEKIATSDASIDVKTRLIILKWINNGDLDSVEGAIAIGKESTVLNGICKAVEAGTSQQEDPLKERRFAIKVHKQTLNAFRNRSDYVKEDFRFKNPRSILKIWTEKEYLNLMRLFRAEIPCPRPIQYRKHVLLMQLIEDEEGKPAPKLQHHNFTSDEQKTEIFGQVKDIMIKMYKQCRLVHADLSEFNLLISNDKIYVIDLAQATVLEHPQALVFLQRDIENVIRFFDKNATEGLPTAHALFTEITDIPTDPEKDLLTQIESFNEQNLSTNLSKFRKKPGDFDLIMMDRENDAKLDEESSESEDE
jgi:serine/threonine-protein kinase RIO1